MKETPIIMSGNHPLLILNGIKTMTRRVIKPQPDKDGGWKGCVTIHDHNINEFCPYGQVGDRLWVRETCYKRNDGIWLYKSDDEWLPRSMNYYKRDVCPSIHMPRWASRITLEITEVRVERVQEISPQDAHDEGCPYDMHGFRSEQRPWFWKLWDSLNAKRGYGWEVNPWVWVISFRRAE